MRGDDFRGSGATMHSLLVAGGPGNYSVRADVLGLAGRTTVLDHLAVFAAVGDEDVRDSFDVILVWSGNPVNRIWVVGLQVGIILEAIRTHEIEGDIPVAVADDADHGLALHALRIGLPLGRAKQRIFAVGAPHRADDHRLILRTELLELRIQIGKPLAAAIAHHDDGLGTLGASFFAVMKLLGAVDQIIAHLRVRVFAVQRQVHAVFIHQRTLGGLRATVGVDQRVHGVPLPHIECDVCGLHVGRRGRRIRQRLHVCHLRLFLRRKRDARGDDGLHDPWSGNQTMLHGGAQSENNAQTCNNNQDKLRLRLQTRHFFLPLQ